MKEYNKDTSEDYEDLVGFINESNLSTDLSNIFGEQPEEYIAKVKEKPKDKVFKEDWQTLYVNFRTLQDYADFMHLIDEVPVPKLNNLVYDPNKKSLFDDLEA